MPTVPPGLPTAVLALDHALDAPRKPGIPLGNWRWVVRQRMAGVRDALVGEAAGSDDGWLAARGGSAFRERNALLSRLSMLGPQILETPDVEATRLELKRLVVDIQRHVQRVNDLVYDEVSLELGGSE
ncbi:hypothetical protein [Nocardioides halotolerans]|jgi:hypothetical protein|uniref:hypothetical protein n=1 Tax=Nocardioides halotolerans TaxID=433660 RepID=UPI00048FFB2C|nr:hypothetical protein [Nocardioides halotolerans]